MRNDVRLYARISLDHRRSFIGIEKMVKYITIIPRAIVVYDFDNYISIGLKNEYEFLKFLNKARDWLCDNMLEKLFTETRYMDSDPYYIRLRQFITNNLEGYK